MQLPTRLVGRSLDLWADDAARIGAGFGAADPLETAVVWRALRRHAGLNPREHRLLMALRAGPSDVRGLVRVLGEPHQAVTGLLRRQIYDLRVEIEPGAVPRRYQLTTFGKSSCEVAAAVIAHCRVPDPSPARHPAVGRVAAWLLGSWHTLAIDRRTAEQLAIAWRRYPVAVRWQRALLWKAAAIAADLGIDQWIVLGAGIIDSHLHHDLRVHNDGKRHAAVHAVVYTDPDPTTVTLGRILAHRDPAATPLDPDPDRPGHAICDLHPVSAAAPAGLTADAGQPPPRIAVRHAPRDVHPKELLPDLVGTIECHRPFAVIAAGVLPWLSERDAGNLIASWYEWMPTGSVMVTDHVLAPYPVAPIQLPGLPPFAPRTRTQITGLLAGLPLMPPGLAPIPDWDPATSHATRDDRRCSLGALVTKPLSPGHEPMPFD